MEADIATQSLGLASNTDFSLISLFLRADLILIICSVYSWAIIFEKIRMFKKLTKVQMNLKKNFGSQNLQKHFIIASHLI